MQKVKHDFQVANGEISFANVCMIQNWMLLNRERGAGSGERGTGNGERGTEVWERVVSGNLHKNPKWPVRIKDPVRSMIEKRRNNT